MTIKAFSLMELIVVIAIVSVLSAMAMPLYNSYIINSNLSFAKEYVDRQVQEAIDYFNANGVFGNVAQVGLPIGADDQDTPALGSSSAYLPASKYVAYMQMTNTAPSGTYCGYGTTIAYLSNFGQGNILSNSTADVVVLQEDYIVVNGTILNRCQYTYNSGGMSGTPKSGDYISGCLNTVDNPTANSDTTNIIQTSCG